MKVRVENLDILKTAEFELGDLTIICGKNNTGKTHATYALYGFLTFFKEKFMMKIDPDVCGKILRDGFVAIELHEYINQSPGVVSEACREFTKALPFVFGSSKELFEKTKFSVQIGKKDIEPIPKFSSVMGSAKRELFKVSKKPDETRVEISLLVEQDKIKIPKELLEHYVSISIKHILFSAALPDPFISSAERTGAAIFRKELDFARNRFIEEAGSRKDDFNPFALLDKVYSDYALPVRRNVEYTRQLGDKKGESFIAEKHPGVLDDFAHIVGGEYKVVKDEVYYVPHANKRRRLTMNESSSAVRTLLDIGFYLRHDVKKGGLLMIDEPELNLHPENQRHIARLFARLANIGIKVFITTHSDYIIKELNTLVMLKAGQKENRSRIKKIMGGYDYHETELLSAEQIRAYYADKALIKLPGSKRRARRFTFTPCDVDPSLGIEVKGFDDSINEMGEIQEEILLGA